MALRIVGVVALAVLCSCIQVNGTGGPHARWHGMAWHHAHHSGHQDGDDAWDDEDDDEGDDACEGCGGDDEGEEGDEGSGGDEGGGDASATSPERLAELEHAVRSAERKLRRARQEAEQSAHDQEWALARARHELDDARKALRHFEGVERPARLAQAELDLQGTVDSLQEQDEEMRQLELLYEQDDLGDKTKEIVLARGRRRHQRVQQRLALAKREFEDLKGFQLEQQRQHLARELEGKERELQRAEWNARIAGEDKEWAIGEAERELEKAVRELKKARPDGDEELDELGYGGK